MAKVVTLVLVLRHSIETRSIVVVIVIIIIIVILIIIIININIILICPYQFRATISMKEMKREEPEMVSMGMATPKGGTDTIKRAEMRVADTDTFKGRVMKVPESEMVCVVELKFIR